MANAEQTRTLVGREAELDRVEEFLGALDSGPAALLVEGEIGIGKSALWNQGLLSASARGQRILRCRPGECETQLAYAALGDLLAGVPEAAMAELPAPQRHALDVALLRAEPDGQQPLQLAIGMGLLGLLRGLAEAAPALVAIDDAQWLDPASESALGFAARRLTDERIGLFCVRRGTGPDVPLGLDRALPGGHFERVTLRGLAGDALDLLLRTHLAVPPSRQTVARIRRATGGNLYFALEIGRALDERGDRLGSSSRAPHPGQPAGARARAARTPARPGALGSSGGCGPLASHGDGGGCGARTRLCRRGRLGRRARACR